RKRKSEGNKTDESDDDNDDDDDEEETTKIGMESLFTTGSTTVTFIPSPQSTMTPSIMSTFTSASQLPTPPAQIPSLDLQSLPTFASVFCFEDRPMRPLTPDRDWNKYVPAAQGEVQSWISALAKQTDVRSSFNELLDTPIDFSNFIMNRLGVDTLTPELLSGPTYELMRGSCASSRKYTTSVTKTKAADYGHIKWIEDLVPRAMWIQEPISYDKHALWGVSHWGRKRQQFYEFAVNQESVLDVYSKRRIIAVTELKIVEWHNYKHLDWIS
nr:hypothetical protein [Tanacetum cinerariifolium]